MEPAEDSLAALDVSRPDRFAADTHWPLFARLRREAPVHLCERSPYGPYWSVTRYDDIVDVEKDFRHFSSEGNVIINDVPAEFDATRAFATSDPPVHTRERKALTPVVSTSRMAAIKEQCRASIGEVLDGLPRAEPFDWVERVSIELTTRMVATLFDFPLAERRLLPYWCEVLVSTPQPGALAATWEERATIVDGYRARVLALWRERAARPPTPDVISALAHDPATAAIVEDPMHLLGTVTLVAGANEAARGGLSGCVVAFSEFPSQWERLRADAALIPGAASEILRWQTPITHMRRTAIDDVELRGKHIRRGDRVVMWYCSANRDEEHFDDADVIRIDRPNAHRHLAYGFGIHRCLGRHVADMQLRLLLEEMLVRFRAVTLVEEPRRRASNFSSGYDRLVVRLRT